MSRISRPPVCSEHELVAATRAGDDRAFEELYARYRERIFSFIVSKVHDHGRAEDIAQDVFMSALRRLRRSDQAIAFKPWIYEIAKNACIDEFRRGSRAREVPLESDGEFVVDRQAASLSAVPTPSAAVESKQRLNDLRGALGGLSASHHQLLVMREFEGMSYDEIGERLDMTRQMVESGLFRARRKLSEEYEELASGQRCEQIQTAIEAGRLSSVSSLGLRDRRRFARHLSHCQPCRHAALMAGVDGALVKPRSVAAKIAALLPFPLWRLPWRSGGAKAAGAGGPHQMVGAGSAGLAQSAGSAFTFGQAAATVAVIIAGAGGGLAVTGLASGGHHNAPAGTHAADHTARHASSASAGSAAASAGAAKAAHARTALLSKGPSAISFAPRTGTTSRPGAARHRRGSASGAPGSGGSGSGSATGTGGGSGGSAAASTVKKTVNGLTSTVNGVSHGVANTLNGVTSGVGKTVNGVTGTVGKTVNGVTNTLGKTVNGVTNTAGKTVNGVTSGVGSAVNGVTQATGTATTPVGQAVNGATNTVGQEVGGATNGVTQTVGGATGGVSKTVNGVTGGLSKTVNTVTGGLTGSAAGSSSASPSQPATPGLQPPGSALGK
ncbi:MAG: sigma-70 family RNA polymerase sigma factor [Solirubrobacteraceae bacterium]